VACFAVERKGHCQILIARICIRNQLELVGLNRLLNELGRVCQEMKLNVPGWQEKVAASLT
jgi:hypothetical protein